MISYGKFGEFGGTRGVKVFRDGEPVGTIRQNWREGKWCRHWYFESFTYELGIGDFIAPSIEAAKARIAEKLQPAA